MKHIKDISEEFSILEVKACVDICLIKHFTTLGPNNKVQYHDNIYRFIFGDTNNFNEETKTLNFRYRVVSEYYSLCEKYQTNSIDAVLLDLKDYYLEYVKNKGIPVYHNTRIDDKAFEDALAMIRSDVLNLIFKLFCNENVFTLFLETPVGRDGLQDQTDIRAGNNYNDYFDTNMSAFRDYLIKKKVQLGDTLDYADITGLCFKILNQYFSEERSKKYANQKRYAVGDSSNIVTSKGEMDAAARQLIEEKESQLPDISLTEIFNKCRQLDFDVFINFSNKSSGKLFYSIFEWYCEFKTMPQLPKYLLDMDGDPKFQYYINSFTDTVLVGNSYAPIKHNLQYRISCCKAILKLLYTEWYSNDKSVITPSMITKLCSTCDGHFSNGTLGEELFKTLFCPGKISSTGNNVECHYVNINKYRASNMISSNNSADSAIVSYFTDKHIECLMQDMGNTELRYILTPAGLERIRLILDIFSDLDNLYNQLMKFNISFTELLPAYYSGEPCTLKGALDFLFRDIYRGSNPSDCKLFSKSNLSAKSKSNPWLFDWSLPKLNNYTPKVSQQVGAGFTQVSRELPGIGAPNYYMHHESAFFCLLSLSFPASFKDRDKFIEFSPFTEKIVQPLEVEDGTDYSLLWRTLGCEIDDVTKEIDIPDDMDSVFKFDDSELGFGLTDLFEDFNEPDETSTDDSSDSEDLDISLKSCDSDLRSEFIANAQPRTIYTIMCLVSLLVWELTSYGTNSYASNYINLYRVGKITQANLRDYFGSVPRVFNLIKLLPKVIFNVMNSPANSRIQAVRPSSLKAINTFLFNLGKTLTADKTDSPYNLLCLMEESISTIQARLTSLKGEINAIYVDNTFYMPVFADIDTVIINGFVYTVKLTGNKLVARIDFNKSRPDVDDSVPKVVEIDITSNDNLKFGLSRCTSFSNFITQCANDNAYNYVRRWEAVVSRLIKAICTEFNKGWVPFIFNTTITWEIISTLFSGADGFSTDEANAIANSYVSILPTKIISVKANKYLVNRWYWANDYYYKYRVHDWMLYDESESIYSYASRSIEEETSVVHDDGILVCREGLLSDTSDGSTRKVVYRKINNYPALDYMSLWNCSKRILESYSDIHRLSYAYTRIPGIGSNAVCANYTNYIYKTLADLYINNDAPVDSSMNSAGPRYTRFHKLNSIAFEIRQAYPDIETPSYRTLFSDSSPNEEAYWYETCDKMRDVMEKDSVIIMKPVVYSRYDTEESVISINLQLNAIAKFFGGSMVSNGSNTLPDTLISPTSRINMFIGFLETFSESIELFKTNHIKGVNNDDKLARSIFYSNTAFIQKFLKDHEMEIDTNMIGNYSQKRKLYDERFYINKNFDLHEATNLLLRKDGVPFYVIKRDYNIKGQLVDLVAFLHAYSFWVAIDQNDASNMFLINYEVM